MYVNNEVVDTVRNGKLYFKKRIYKYLNIVYKTPNTLILKKSDFIINCKYIKAIRPRCRGKPYNKIK